MGYRHVQLLILPSGGHHTPKSGLCSILCLCFHLGHLPFVGFSPSCTQSLHFSILHRKPVRGVSFPLASRWVWSRGHPLQEIRGKRVRSDYAQVWLRPVVTSGWLCPLTRGHCSFPGGQPYLTTSCWVLVIAHFFQPMVGSSAAFILSPRLL